jgi:hypothetical protein
VRVRSRGRIEVSQTEGGGYVLVDKYVGECERNNCPQVFTTDRGSFLFQGAVVKDHGLTVPTGEDVVELPASIVRELARKVLADGLI